MKVRSTLAVLWLLASACATSSSSLSSSSLSSSSRPPSAEDARFTALLEEDWERNLREYPTMATYVGDLRYNDRLTDESFEAIARRKQELQALSGRLKTVDRSRLSAAHQLNYDLFLRNVASGLEGQRFPEEYLPISQLGGVHDQMAELAQIAPKRTVKDIQDFVKRLRAVPLMVDQSIALMRKGLEAGVTPPRVTLRDVAGLIRNQIVESPEQSPVYRALFEGFPPSLKEEEPRLRAEVATALREAVVPSYRKLLAFFEADYYPRARESIAMSALPDGAAWYAYRVKEMTTTDLSPEAIHQLGQAEVKRILTEMEKVKEEAGFKGSVQQFAQFLLKEPRFAFRSREELLMTYRDLTKRLDPALPKLFRTLPRLTYGVLPVPAYSEKTVPAGYYMPGSLEAGRAGYFFVNTYDLPSRSKWMVDALVLHETVPGHHFQVSLAQEQGEVPSFRRHGFYGAFVEGWGLYAESLGYELGVYQDPYAKFGRLASEMLRAIRLVVDTGLHSQGWTREQALAFFRENSGEPEHDIVVEVDRYIVNPGQALCYKVGELKIQELRAWAARELGPRFDVRTFHDVVLRSGALPLPVLERHVKAWGAQAQTAP
ncbi:DUF885 domain-containing protein [Stigmatella sp. ncwal1]|uniref:DUF885 domain-containing protein n=1 Tax=Stigmatella ashevillensis TaxID=2995309 RepID=A0ABT5DJM8_9BACT|nr:DUF885 domain-containing protein [Stigmatella ashevillena]MDC0713857.1 DUF885 domain-containing protein [Stigmatella ashevillena]